MAGCHATCRGSATSFGEPEVLRICNAVFGVVLPDEMYELRLGISLGDAARCSFERENSLPDIICPGVMVPLVPGRLSLKPRAYVGPKSIEGMSAEGVTLASNEE